MLVAVMLAVLTVFVYLLDVEGIRHRKDTLSGTQSGHRPPFFIMVMSMRVRVLELREASAASKKAVSMMPTRAVHLATR